ncbi:bifunctional diguanylate cyclase/phosphodiesterase [Aureimonas sp. AU4]|uniref:putative bifunctional diguanylate cyclase/phosphodiesterase n=1 Tax=Aureimonas sp. AU4 TaxID=1638163 RepID=UPI00078027F7|nr:EAL domain-containing protein [Aureimonas sp. AU4]
MIPIIGRLARKRMQAPSGWLLFLIAASGVGTLGLVVLAGLWAGTESDAAALERQRQLMTERLHDQVEQAAQIVGQIGAGYMALTQPVREIEGAWSQVGASPAEADPSRTLTATTMTRVATAFFRYDQAFIVDGYGQLAMDADAETRKGFNWKRSLLRPLLNDPRLQRPHRTSGGAASPPAAIAELLRLEGRATIVGVAAIGAFDEGGTTGGEPVPSQTRYLITIRFLDGTALDALSREQGLNGARYARAADPEESEVAFQIDSTTTGEPIGFIVWTPDLPGSRVIGRLAPALSLAAIVIAVLFGTLLMRLRGSLIELRSSEYQARHLALHDVLTKLPNRALFAERLESCLAQEAPGGKRTAVALIDLDRFKAVNDTFGHAAGDELIRSAADRMLTLLRPQDTLARLGGDEFALLLPDVGDDDEVIGTICRGLIDVLARPFDLTTAATVAHISGSIGVVAVPDAGRSADDAMRHADIALYEAKARGRGRWIAFGPSLEGGRHDRDTVRTELRAVLAGLDDPAGRLPSIASSGPVGTLELHFQTIHRARDEYATSGAEALVRWRHGDRGLLFPDSFIPVAEDGGLIDQLGLWVLREACRAAVCWDPATFVAVNVSPHQLRRSGFADDVLAILCDTGLTPPRLELELTEAAFINVDQAAEAGLARLRAEGVRIALDDFGMGFSSLSDVIHLGVDRIKIDRSFVTLLGTKAHGAAIVGALVGLGRNLGIAVTAEGVETQAQRDFLVALGCTDLQGYLFSTPVPIEEIRLSEDAPGCDRLIGPQIHIPAA